MTSSWLSNKRPPSHHSRSLCRNAGVIIHCLLMLDLLVKTSILFCLYYFSRSVETTMSSGPPAQQTQLSYIPKTAQCRKEVEAAVSEGDPSTCLNDAEVPCQQLVPYEPVRFLPFQDNQREFVFAGKEWVIVQHLSTRGPYITYRETCWSVHLIVDSSLVTMSWWQKDAWWCRYEIRISYAECVCMVLAYCLAEVTGQCAC